MNRDGPTSFNRIFGGGSGIEETDSKPSVHELFSAFLREELSLPQFAQALGSLHGIRLPPAAQRLLSSVDAASGRLTFTQFQKSLMEDENDLGQAGRPNVFTDQARAIIEDNHGAPSAPSIVLPAKHSTDISADPFVKQRHRIDKTQARGPFSGNPVMKTNKPSGGNPLVASRLEDSTRAEAAEDPSGTREMAHTATRMFIGGELDRQGYEEFMRRCGVELSPDSELQRLILKQDQTGDCKFVDLARALQRELARMEARC